MLLGHNVLIYCSQLVSVAKKATIHHVTAMLATSKNVLFPGHSHLLTTGTDDPSLNYHLRKVPGHQYLWLAGKMVMTWK